MERIGCPKCGTLMHTKKGLQFHPKIRGEVVEIEVTGWLCPACGFQTVDAHQMKSYFQAASNAYRKRHGLLTGPDIVALRKRLGMSQQDAAAFLKVGVASLKRWEGSHIQDEAMDRLLRISFDRDELLRHLQHLQRRLGSAQAETQILISSFGDQPSNYRFHDLPGLSKSPGPWKLSGV